MSELDIKKRIIELADRSYNAGIFTFTDFLGLAEFSDFMTISNQLNYASYKIFGGFESAERVLVRFGNEDNLGYSVDFPISCIHITPLLKKFSDDLSHRDFLGALMNLGIERSTLGDIKVNENEAYIFCLENMADYIVDNLTKIKHTSVKCHIITDLSSIDSKLIGDEPTEKQIVISSLRADAVISKVYNLSRNQSLELFRKQLIYINGRLNENNSAVVNEGDIINARGYGKFKISGQAKETRKGRIAVNVMVW